MCQNPFTKSYSYLLSLEALFLVEECKRVGKELIKLFLLQGEIWLWVNFLALFSWSLDTIAVSVVSLGHVANTYSDP